MHTFGENASSGTGVPAFLAKLWRLVDDESTDDLILWSTDGRSFIIQNQARFAKELLPLNYKHNNMASFIRQLNMYGFHKITSIDNGGLRFDRDEMEFSHPCFQKGHPFLLEHIKRKITHPKPQDDKNIVKIEAVNRMLNEVKTMRGRQDALDSRFSSMKQENEALWREVAILRQKHLKQQQIVNKLIQFLVTMVQPNRSGLGGVGAGLKRRFQLMINDAPRSSKAQRPASPIIHELEEELMDDISNANEESIRITDVPNVASPQGQEFDPFNYNYQPSLHTSASYPVVDLNNKELYTPSYVLDEDSCSMQSGSDPSSGRKSVDYLVDHIDDFEQTEPLQSKKTIDDTLSTPLFKKVQKDTAYTVELNQRKRTTSNEIDAVIAVKKPRFSASGSNEGSFNVTKNGSTSTTAQEKKSLLKTSGNKQGESAVYVKREKNLSQNVLVPDIVTVQDTFSSVPSNGSGKSFYSKEDLFSDEVPAQLFDDDDCLLDAEVSPLLSSDVDLNMGVYGNIQNSQTANTGNVAKAGTSTSNSNVITLADGTSMQVAKFNGKSNINDISKFVTPSELNSHLNDVDNDLDTIKDILKGDSYQFDPTALLNTGENPSEYRYFIPQNQIDPVAIAKLFNNEGISPYEIAQIQANDGTISTLPQSTVSSAELTNYPQDVDLSELLDIADPNEYDDADVNISVHNAQ